MSLLSLIVILVVLAVFWYVAERFLPAPLSIIAKVVIVVIALYYLLTALGLMSAVRSISVPNLR